MISSEIIIRTRAQKRAQAPYVKNFEHNCKCSGKWCRRNKLNTGVECGQCQQVTVYNSKHHKRVIVFDPEDLIDLELLGIHHTY